MQKLGKFQLDPEVVKAERWQDLDRAALAGKKVICFLPMPFDAFHEPHFRDLPSLVSLWVVEGPEAVKQAKILGLRFVELSVSNEELVEALNDAPPAGRYEARTLPNPPVPGILAKALSAFHRCPEGQLHVSIFREFVKPPYGGANQFMLALKEAMEQKGVKVSVNEVGEHIQGYFFDSLWFDEKILRKLEKLKNPVVVHRIDGPIHLYRRKDKEIDDKIFEVNKRLATSTVVQSDFTLEKLYETGYRPVRPVVVRNAASPSIFFPRPRTRGKKLRLIATSWSDNPNKGGPIYKWLEENLDFTRFDFTFVGRCSEKLTKAQVIAPVASEKLAELLCDHDIYLTASQNDPCSNALIEALTCGLPAIALRSGGHPELLGAGGLSFQHAEEIPALLDTMARDYDSYRAKVNPPRMSDVAELYLSLVREP